MPLRLLPRAALLAGLALIPFAASGQRMVLADTQAEPVVVDTATISTEVTGRLAVTTFDLTFRNPNARPLEGTFEFPLLEGQSVVRFALDIGGTLREAVPVAKEQGRAVFEAIERRRADPGLLEQTAGNNYRARVFPLPAGGTRRLVIAYQEDLGRAAGDPRYRLALDFPGQLAQFNLRITVHSSAAGSPAVARTTLALELPAWENAQLLTVERRAFAARGVLELDLPRRPAPTLISQHLGDRDFFYGELPMGAAVAPTPRPSPKTIGLLWDSSGSGRERDHLREFALLDAWFTEVRDVEVRLISLRDTAAPVEKFIVRGGNWAALRAALEKTVYDGATSFDGLADDSAVQEWLLFSDGLFNYGTTSGLSQLPLKAPVHAVVASPRADPTRLRGLATRGKGEFANLLATDAPAAARRLRTASFRVLAVERDPEAVAQVFPEVGALIQEDVLVVTGQLRQPSATIRLKVGHTEGDARTVTLEVRSGAPASQLAARAWATAKIAALSLDPETNREDIKRTSQEFGIVTAGTSLIVLETLEDYVRYAITPPEELRAEWTARNRVRDTAFQKRRVSHLDQLARQFAERARWWKQKFPKNTPARQPESAPKGTTYGSVALGQVNREAPAGSTALLPDELAIRLRSPAPAAAEDKRLFGALRFDPAFLQGNRAAVDSTGTGAEQTPVDGFNVGAGAPASTIALKAWQPTAGYLDRLRRTAAGERYGIYLEERADHRTEPGFYLDVAGFFLDEKDSPLGLRILSNLAELALEDAALLRVLGHRLVQAGRPELALPLFEHVLRIRGEEPQSRRDLALVCAALRQNQRAVDLLWEVVAQPWDGRFPDIELIAVGELNAIASTCGEKLDLSKVDVRLRENLPVGLRAVLTWDADSCDIDLWLDDPNGERAMYNHPLTYQGGRMSRDFTGGYGPEEFLLRDPKPGKYTVRINYYGDRRQAALGPVTAQVRLITGFGTPAQKEQRLTVRLAAQKETLEIGTIEIGGKP